MRQARRTLALGTVFLSACGLSLSLSTLPAFSATAMPAAPDGDCLAGAVPISVRGADEPRGVTLDDGRLLRIAGIETFALLDIDPDQAEAALLRELRRLADQGGLRARILSQKPDRYGRLPALIATGDGVLLQEAVAHAGVAIALAAGDVFPCFDRIVAAEDAGRRAGHGFWAQVRLPPAEPQALAARIGRFAIFEGRVLTVGNRPERTYLNFGRRWTEDVTVSITKRDRARFGGETALAALAGKRLRLRGFLQAHGGPSLDLRSPLQIEVLKAPPGGHPAAGAEPAPAVKP